MNSITFKKAKLRDVDNLTEIFVDFWENYVREASRLGDVDFSNSRKRGTTRLKHHKLVKNYLSEYVSKKTNCIFVAELMGEQIIGFVCAGIFANSHPFMILPKSGFLQFLYVSKKYRGSRVAIKFGLPNSISLNLCKKVETWWRDKGCEFAELGVLSNNARAISFYRTKLDYDVLFDYTLKKRLST